MNHDKNNVRWAVSWACLVAAFGLHVADEALTGFLPFYNSIIASLRETYGWVPFPTFTFSVWLGGLIGIVVVLFALTPLVLRGHRWLRGVSCFLGVLMIANAIGHMSMSLSMGAFAPGVYSSPILLATASALIVMARRAKRGDASSKIH